MIKENLNRNQIEILRALYQGYGGEYCHNYGHLEYSTKLSKDILKKEVKELKAFGLVETIKGLMDDDGRVAGSGFTIPYKMGREVGEYLDDLEKKDREEAVYTDPIFELLNCYEIDGSEIHDGMAHIDSGEAFKLTKKIRALVDLKSCQCSCDACMKCVQMIKS